MTATTDALPPPPEQRAVALPISVSEWATLYAPFPLTEIAWTQMLAVLSAMKPALVAPPEQPQPADSTPAPAAAEAAPPPPGPPPSPS